MLTSSISSGVAAKPMRSPLRAGGLYSKQAAWREHLGGKLPVKWCVLTSTPLMMPGHPANDKQRISIEISNPPILRVRNRWK